MNDAINQPAFPDFEATLVSDPTATFGRVGYGGVYYFVDDMHNINLVGPNGSFQMFNINRWI